MTILSSQNFKTMFPVFDKEDDIRISFWITLFENSYDKERFAQFWEQGCYLYVAHNLTLEIQANKAISDSNGDGIAEISAGVVTSSYKSTGPLIKSKSYSNKGTALEGQGQWGATIYGQRFFQILKIVGMGVLYVPTSY